MQQAGEAGLGSQEEVGGTGQDMMAVDSVAGEAPPPAPPLKGKGQDVQPLQQEQQLEAVVANGMEE